MVIPRQFRSAILGAIVLSVVIHTLFCIQVFMALPGGMALDGSLFVFMPHYMLMFFFPPSYPIHDDGVVDYVQVWGKLAVAIPASLAYGFVLVAISNLVRRCLKKSKP